MKYASVLAAWLLAPAWGQQTVQTDCGRVDARHRGGRPGTAGSSAGLRLDR